MRRGRREPVDPAAGRTGRLAHCACRASALLLLAAAPAGAQEAAPVYFDGSLGDFEGSAHSIPDPDSTGVEYQIDYCPSCGTDTHPFGSQGKLVDSSLFHSLRDIDVPADDAARFAVSQAGVDVDHVFARITSGQETQFDGVLRSELDADIYLLNPFGLVFGSTSQIDVSGTFYVSTADEVRFENGQVLETRAGGGVPMENPLLEVGDPITFGFLVDAEAPARIVFDSDTGLLSSRPGASLTAVAGSIEIDDGAGTSAKIVSNGGQIKLAAAPADSSVPVDVESVDVDDLASDAAVVHMAQNSEISVSGAGPSGPARIVIRAGRFETVQSSVAASIAVLKVENTGAGTTDPAAIDIEVAGTISLDAGKIESVNNGTPGGNIRLVGETIDLFEAANVHARIALLFDDAPGSDIHVEATTVQVREGSMIQTSDNREGLSWGKVGDISVLADRVKVSGPGSAISTASHGTGNGATILVDATDVVLEGRARIQADRLPSVFASNVPDAAGGIEVLAENLSVLDRGAIVSTTSTDIDGASIQIGSAENRVENLSITDGAIGSVTTAKGAGGDVTVHARSVALNRTLDTADSNPQISALTTRKFTRAEEPDEDGVWPGVWSGGEGPGGNLTIRAESVQLDNGSQLRATTRGGVNAPGGILTVVVDGILSADGTFAPPLAPDGTPPAATPSGIFAKSELIPPDPDTRPPAPPTTGAGGKVDITAGSVILTAGAEISAAADSEGDAGSLDLVADTVLVEGDPETNATSAISVRTIDGAGGSLSITADLLQAHNNGIVTASTSGTGASGNLSVAAREIDIAGEGSGVFAQSNFENIGAGRAGDISLAPRDGEQLTLRVRDGAALSVESVQNAAGVIEITDAALIEVSKGGRINATVRNVVLEQGEQPDDLASDIRIIDADIVRMNQGTLAAETAGDGVGGTITVDATSVELIDSTMTAQARASGAGGSIDITASDLQMTGGTMTAETSGTGQGGSIGVIAEIAEFSEAVITARSTGTALDSGNAGNISVETGKLLRLARSEISAETHGGGAGGTITVQSAGDVFLSDFSSITTKSTAKSDGGDAGNIIIAAGETFEAEHSSITTTAEDAGGGRISIQGGKLVHLFESLVETTVKGETGIAGANAGDIDMPLRGDEGSSEEEGLSVAGAEGAPQNLPEPAIPESIVINRSTIRANAVADDAGNITITGHNVLISSDSLIQATSEEGVNGVIRVTSPDGTLVSQVTPLSGNFIDPSDRLLPPCAARTTRSGSFVVQRHPTMAPPPDSPLSPSLLGGENPAAADFGPCAILEESS
ncbi:MAG: filamentous hemagglutinin N-terminal domain-containing protein [Deltaproteobacteria bacterium]|nr:filamentous hemagglutinin N-terminal domain-containing protein [Deltaproteobacteria bacterium]